MTTEPSFEQVRRALRAALFSPDPWKRAEAEAKLELWDLPVDPAALKITVRREAMPLAWGVEYEYEVGADDSRS